MYSLCLLPFNLLSSYFKMPKERENNKKAKTFFLSLKWKVEKIWVIFSVLTTTKNLYFLVKKYFEITLMDSFFKFKSKNKNNKSVTLYFLNPPLPSHFLKSSSSTNKNLKKQKENLHFFLSLTEKIETFGMKRIKFVIA